MTHTPDDADIDALLANDADAPNDMLDARIRQAARQAIDSSDAASDVSRNLSNNLSGKPPSPKAHNWRPAPWMGVAATFLLAALLVPLMLPKQDQAPDIVLETAPAPSAASADRGIAERKAEHVEMQAQSSMSLRKMAPQSAPTDAASSRSLQQWMEHLEFLIDGDNTAELQKAYSEFQQQYPKHEHPLIERVRKHLGLESR